MMFCPECGQKFTGEGLFCTQCGTRKPDVPPVVPVVETPAPVVQPVVPPVVEPVAQPVQQPRSQPIQEQVTSQQKTTSNKTWIFGLLLGIIIGAAIVFGFHLFSSEDDSKAEEEASQMQSEPVLTEDDTMDTVITATPAPSQAVTEESVEEHITTPSQDSMPQEDASADMAEVEEDEEIVANAEPTEDLYLLDTDSQLITVNDLRGLTPEEIRLVRNEIYARYGYTFTDSALQEYFEAQSWYQSNPELNAQTFNNSMLSDIEFTNIELIVEYEASLN